MDSRTDQQLLSDYAERQSEPAFSELVRRHLDLVYSAALRMVGNPHSAEDVAQGVFVALAQNARKLRTRPLLSGWLHVTARNLAVKAVRQDVRRRAREASAASINDFIPSETEVAWEQIAASLDQALEELSQPDRDALLLRYFQKLSANEIGSALGLSNDAAQKLISRALERLRKCIARRGVAVGSATLAVALPLNAVQAAPLGLATTVSAAALATVTIPTTFAGGSLVGILMTANKSKFVTAMIAITLGIPLALLWRQNLRLRNEIATLRKIAAAPAVTPSVTVPAREASIDQTEQQRLRKEHLELLSLRGRVTQLASELRRKTSGKGGEAAAALPDNLEKDSILFSAMLTNRVANGNTLVVGGWSNGKIRGYLVLTPVIHPADNPLDAKTITIQSQVVNAPENIWTQIGWGDARSETRRSTLAGQLTTDQLDSLLHFIEGSEGAKAWKTSRASGLDGERMGFGFSVEDDAGSGVLMAIDVYPRIAPDGQSVDLQIQPSPINPDTPIHPTLKATAQNGLPSK